MSSLRRTLSLTTSTLLLMALLLSSTACQSNLKREAHRTQGLLDEADLLIELRRFDDAQDKANQALKTIRTILTKSPENIDYRLLEVRAYMVLFMTKNILVIESAEPRQGSLVRLPKPYDYVEYDTTATPAEKILKDIVNTEQNLPLEQQGYVHGMLAAILRLKADTAPDADREYELALGAYKAWLRELAEKKPVVGSHDWKMSILKNQIHGLLMARAEVNFLKEDWHQALELLKEVMAGSDLKYFEVQLPFIDKQISDIERHLATDQTITTDPRVQRLTNAINRAREAKRSSREKLAGLDPRRAQLLQLKLDLEETKNNLLYRIVCYKRLGLDPEYKEARLILRTFYPELDAELSQYLTR